MTHKYGFKMLAILFHYIYCPLAYLLALFSKHSVSKDQNMAGTNMYLLKE